MSTRYWWVSQNQTYNHEVGGGYMWAPKTDKRGGSPTSYKNMTEIRSGDIIFSFAGKQIKAIGIALGNAYTSVKPRVFEKAGEAWNDEGWRVDVLYESTLNPIFPSNHMDLLAPLLPERNSPIRLDGAGNQVYLCEISQFFGDALLALTSTPVPEMPLLSLEDLAFNADEQELISATSITETVKATLVQARRGQGLFRSRVQTIEKACRVTGLSAEKFLIASHIKPWSKSENDERLDGNNGLFLSPHIDKLFDGGFISFSHRGEMLVSPKLDSEVLTKWSIDPKKNVGRFNSDQAYFLEHHNSAIFQES
jgi:hypothetical protein